MPRLTLSPRHSAALQALGAARRKQPGQVLESLIQGAAIAGGLWLTNYSTSVTMPGSSTRSGATVEDESSTSKPSSKSLSTRSKKPASKSRK